MFLVVFLFLRTGILVAFLLLRKRKSPLRMLKKMRASSLFLFASLWSGWPDLNRRPQRPERCALPTAPHPETLSIMVWDTRVELATSRPPGVRATTAPIPVMKMVWVTGLEPATSTSQTSRATNCATPRRNHIISYIRNKKHPQSSIKLLDSIISQAFHHSILAHQMD